MSDFQSYTPYVPEETHENQPTGGIKVNHSSGHNSISVKDGQSTFQHSESTYQISASDLIGHEKGSWQATARGKGGHPSSVIAPDTMVTIDGIQAKVSDMVKAQMLAVDSEGNYYRPEEYPELRNGEQQSPKDMEPPSKDIVAEMPSELAAAVNEAIGDVSQQALDTITGLGIGAALGHLSLDNVIKDYASKSGKDIAESGQRVQFVVNAYQTQADSHLMKHCGLSKDDLPAFYEFAKHPANQNALSAALTGQVYGRKMNDWNHLANKFMNKTPPSTEALIKAGGYEIRKGNNGETLVKIKGMWMTDRVAASSGWL